MQEGHCESTTSFMTSISTVAFISERSPTCRHLLLVSMSPGYSVYDGAHIRAIHVKVASWPLGDFLPKNWAEKPVAGIAHIRAVGANLCFGRAMAAFYYHARPPV
jgi:hypothetical protein